MWWAGAGLRLGWGAGGWGGWGGWGAGLAPGGWAAAGGWVLGAAECADLGWVGVLRLRAAACWGFGGLLGAAGGAGWGLLGAAAGGSWAAQLCWGCWLGAVGGCWGLLGAGWRRGSRAAWRLGGSGLWAGLGAGLGSSGFETEIGLLENGEVVSCAVGLGWARSSGFETEIGLLENGEVVSRPEKKVSRWPTATSNFYLFLS